eukprot:gnl/TRDRNA2_/TRDRNA2_27874_c0_seq2.p1 gnl/TRDRNA2_/TRDRNA2_27874_c0~~gnl/TRDRNA2_/TRDRNA2_27874_c0_seq2.p1  ORF type:complete len:504 (+),score=63.83 gnl/TRDRNA2_/TRDRNA2_27874_c0_seq2:100-1611(+)
MGDIISIASEVEHDDEIKASPFGVLFGECPLGSALAAVRDSTFVFLAVAELLSAAMVRRQVARILPQLVQKCAVSRTPPVDLTVRRQALSTSRCGAWEVRGISGSGARVLHFVEEQIRTATSPMSRVGTIGSGEICVIVDGVPVIVLDQAPPRVLRTQTLVRGVACGADFMVVVDVSGRVLRWPPSRASASAAALGAGPPPAVVAPFDGAEGAPCAVGAACGRRHVLILVGDGGVYSYGSGPNGELGVQGVKNITTPQRLQVAAPIVAAACGACHSILVAEDGDGWLWGRGTEGQLGISGVYGALAVPTPLQMRLSPSTLIVAAAGGTSNSFFVDDLGCLWACGQGGTLGLGSSENQPVPKQVRLPSAGGRAVAVSAGGTLAAVLSHTGSLWLIGWAPVADCAVPHLWVPYSPLQAVSVAASSAKLVAVSNKQLHMWEPGTERKALGCKGTPGAQSMSVPPEAQQASTESKNEDQKKVSGRVVPSLPCALALATLCEQSSDRS